MNQKNETVLQVEGMSCRSCVSHVDRALRELAGVRGVQVKLREGLVLIEHDPELAPLDSLIEALREVGYESRPSQAA